MPMLKKALKFSAILFGGIVLCALALLILSKVFLGNSTQTASIASGNSPVSADEFFESR